VLHPSHSGYGTSRKKLTTGVRSALVGAPDSECEGGYFAFVPTPDAGRS
jgi:hypothetical protein